jgi:hypothetical protein
MKKLLVPLAAIMLLALAVPAAFGEAELGIGATPSEIFVATPNLDPITSFHVGWSWSALYLTWDAYAVPDYWVYDHTTYIDQATHYTVPGYLVPGFLNLFDVGVKLNLRPFVGYLEIGTDYLYLRGGQTYGKIGVNARLGLGVRFGWWGLNISGTQFFASWNDLESAFGQAANGDTSLLVAGMFPTLNLVFYF